MRNTRYIKWSSSSTTGSEFSLLSQMMSLATFRLVSMGATIMFSRGVMKLATFSSMDMRDRR